MGRHDAAADDFPVQDRFLPEPMPFALLDQPLEFLFADHFRQRSLCAALRRFAETGTASRAEADAVIGFLRRDLEWHHEDEDADLFPALRRRVQPEDALGITLARLTDDHRTSGPMVDQIVDALAERPADDPVVFSPGTREVMRAYATSEHKHLAIENSIVLAIARIRLTRADLAAMSRSMKTRRGG